MSAIWGQKKASKAKSFSESQAVRTPLGSRTTKPLLCLEVGKCLVPQFPVFLLVGSHWVTNH